MKAAWLAEPAGKPGVFQLVVMKPGFARAESDAFALEPGREGRPRELAPIRLGPDVTLRGTVIDPQGRPVEGAWVEVQPASVGNEAHTARTDKNGHFALRGLPGGAVRLDVRYGDLRARRFLSGDRLLPGDRDPASTKAPAGRAATGPARPAGPAEVAGDGATRSRMAGRQVVRWQTPPARRFPGSDRRPRLLERHETTRPCPC